MYRLCAIVSALLLSACATPEPRVVAVPAADQAKYEDFVKMVNALAKPDEARIFIVNEGSYSKSKAAKSKASEFVLYNDVQLSGQDTLRFKEGEYVQYSVKSGDYQVTGWSVCGRVGNAPLKPGEVMHPHNPAFRTYSNTQPGFLFKPIKLEAGQAYVYTFSPECWLNRVAGATELFVHVKRVDSDNALYLPFKAVETRQEVK